MWEEMFGLGTLLVKVGTAPVETGFMSVLEMPWRHRLFSFHRTSDSASIPDDWSSKCRRKCHGRTSLALVHNHYSRW